MGTNDEILDILKNALPNQMSVRFFDVYKGIPITYEGRLINVSPAQVMFQVHKYQATCLEVTRRAYFRSDAFPCVVQGNVLSVDFLNDIAILGNLKYIKNSSMGNRSIVRVIPKEITPVEVSLKKRTLFTEMADLSISGIGVTTGRIYYDPKFFTLHSRATLRFKLPIAEASLNVSGILVNVRHEHNTYRLGIRIQPNVYAKGYISQYIAQRQVEIQRELQLMHDLFVQLHARGK